MKKIYEYPQLTIISLETADVITLSGKDENIGEWDFN